MTTVAYKDGLMACDSCWTCDDVVDTLTSKIVRLSSGALLGQAGDNDARAVERLLDKVKTPAGLPSRDDILKIRLDYMGLLVLPRGRIFKVSMTHSSEANWNAEFKDDVGVWEIGGFAAIGSGRLLAIGAMAAGKSAQEAVRIACRYDINSRPPVYTVKLAR
jgi:hypothetical protein